ncbi:MAG: carboxypeptidase regulatory-like domain-containing protein, partial [Saprospiraceae bacterium]
GTPYILTAFHCQDGFTPKYDFWRFDFNYESPTCNNPGLEPAHQSVLGSTLRASRRQNDFLLLETDTIPETYNVYYNGWNRNNAAPTSSFSIHHPKGDIKKIAADNQTAQIYTTIYQWSRGDGQILYTTPANHLLRVQFDASTVEVGSSGAALFDGNGRIVGQLHGGNDLGSCTTNAAFYDRFTLSWEGGGTKETRLKDWLDPDNTNANTLDGIERISASMFSLSGFVRTRKGEGIAGVTISLDGPVKASTVTDTAGAYRFQNLTPSEFYTVALGKDGNDKNGVNVLDISLSSKHILGVQPFDDPLKRLAADVNNSKNITVLDNVTLRKLILGVDAEFTALPSWRFIPANFEFTDADNPWDEFIPAKFTVPKLESVIQNFNFLGYKTGDVDFSANPKN